MSGTDNGGRNRAYEQLRESEELHRATLESISDAVFLTDDSGVFTFICPNVDVIFGFVPDEVQAMGNIGQLLGPELFDPGELAVRGEIRNVEREVSSKSGDRRVVLIGFKRVSIQGGTVLYTCRDITEVRRAERELAATRLELAHAARLALVGELTASIVHEIKQPITAILANAAAGARLTERAAEIPAARELQEIFRDVEDECRNAAEITQHLGALARKRPLELKALHVNAVAQDVLHLVAADARRRCVTVRAELAPALPMIDADRVCLQHAILNLVVNAMEATEQISGGERQVVMQTRQAAGEVEYAVSDNGQGIADDHLPKLFDPFFTTKPDGIGLGLAITRSIVEAHAGRIWAEGGRGRGATFHLVVPSSRQAAGGPATALG